jgi:hypothetical protein
LAQSFEFSFLAFEITRAGGVVLDWLLVHIGREGREIYLVLLEESPFFAFFWLSSFSVVAPLDGISHGRHSDSLPNTVQFINLD